MQLPLATAPVGETMVKRFVLGMAFVFAAACSHPRLGPGDTYNSQVITEDEIEASHASNAFEVIRKLRANFLTDRGQTGINRTAANSYPTVYVDDQEFGPISTLANIPASQIAMIRLYRVSEANQKYGSHNLTGVIAITTKR